MIESQFKGYKSYKFYTEGRECIVVVPHQARIERPWVWRMEFFDAFSYADMALLKEGWHIAYCSVSDMYGHDKAIDSLNKFYEDVRLRFNLNAKADLFGFSRGGMYGINYGSTYPEHTRCLYLDAPVIDLGSWPGGLYQGVGSSECWEECLKIYEISEEASREAFRKLGVEKINKLIAADLPVILVAGDTDAVVPYEENGMLLAKRYEACKKPIRVIVKKGIGHHPHSLEDPEPIVEFIKSIEF